MDRRRDAGKSGTNFPNLRALTTTTPRTKSGRVLSAWPEIQAHLNRGTKMHEIWEALRLDGIEMSYGQFRTYIWRIRKRLKTAPEEVAAPPTASPEVGTQMVAPTNSPPSTASETQPHDPLANIRRELERKRTSGFVYSPFPDDPLE